MSVAEKKNPEMSVSTMRFGVVSFSDQGVISFERPMPGFEKARRFILIEHDKEGVFKWLQSVEDPNLAFLVTNPNLFKPDYSAPIGRAQMDCIGAKDELEVTTLVMVCVSHSTGQVTINLKGPLVLNQRTMKAMQLIVDRDEFQTHFAIS
jgi:flagellar assembly factor FliW